MTACQILWPPEQRICFMAHISFTKVECKRNLVQQWYDKLQIVVCANGVAGINFNTLVSTARPSCVSDVLQTPLFASPQASRRPCMERDTCVLSLMRPLWMRRKSRMVHASSLGAVMDLDESISMNIHYAETSLSDQIMQSDTAVLEFSSYGKRWIVQEMSPDAFMQVCMATAYYELYGTFVSTYESVSTKAYFHGRTEAGRMCTTGSRLCEGALQEDFGCEDAALQRSNQGTFVHCKTLLPREGVDRHLFALNAMCREHGVKVLLFLEGHAYKKLTTSILSTSNCGNPSLRLFGFGPVVSMGFGMVTSLRMTECLYA